MLRDTLVATVIGFFITVMSTYILIPQLHKFKFGQQVRDDGPRGHLKKSGTPTMGGIAFLLGILVSILPFLGTYPLVIPVLLFTLGFGLIGFLDDFLKIKKKQSEGLHARAKLLLQILFSLLFVGYIYKIYGISYPMILPFSGVFGKSIFIKLGIFWIPFILFVILGTDNGVNFTDGQDGLCTSVTIIVTVFFASVALYKGIAIAPIAGCVVGALMGFLIFNVYPARVFMGDTGSLALGGFIASIAIIMQMPLFIAVVGLIYMVEVISVIIQVLYFKKTGGKRFFKMSPLHHHYELSGYSETQIVAAFSIITAILSILAFVFL